MSTSPTKQLTKAAGKTKNRLFFDCETAPFSDEFKKAESNTTRLKLACGAACKSRPPEGVIGVQN
jgi:hypothetical protein